MHSEICLQMQMINFHDSAFQIKQDQKSTTVSIKERETKMFLPFLHLIDEKFASLLTYLNSW